jgi:CheY-like chemotaxis protein
LNNFGITQAPGLSAPAPAGEALNWPARIVVIDDDADDLTLLQRMLRKGHVGIPVFAFQRAMEALAFLRGTRGSADAASTVIFCDLKMPGVDGFEFLRLVRAEMFPATRVLIVSGCALEADVERARELGASGYLEKTPSPEALVAALENPCFAETGTRQQLFRSWENRLQQNGQPNPLARRVGSDLSATLR